MVAKGSAPTDGPRMFRSPAARIRWVARVGTADEAGRSEIM